MALWNELAVSPLRTSSYTASLQGFGGYSRYVSEEMTNSLDTLSTALLSETLLFSAIKNCTSLNCTDNISWSLCSCYRSHIYIILSTVNDIFQNMKLLISERTYQQTFLSYISVIIFCSYEKYRNFNSYKIYISSHFLSVFQRWDIKKRASVERWSSWLRYRTLEQAASYLYEHCLIFFNRKFQAHCKS